MSRRRKVSPNSLPEHAASVWAHLQKDSQNELFPVAEKLFAPRPDLLLLWNTLAELNREAYDDLWVSAFLSSCKAAGELPAYARLPQWKRKELAEQIEGTVHKLTRLLRNNDLDAHLYRTTSGRQLKLYVANDSVHQERILSDDTIPKVRFTGIIEGIAERSTKLLTSPAIAKQGENATAVHFVRHLSALLLRRYEKPLHPLVATACNAIHDTDYTQADVNHLLNRVGDEIDL